MDELLFRLTLLLSDQISDLQRNKFIEDNKIYFKAYNEVLKLMKILQNNPETKFICHDGKFWLEEEIDKKYYRNKYKLI